MRFYCKYIFLVILAQKLIAFNLAQGRTDKMALLIGVQNYRDSICWPKTYAENDIDMMERLLSSYGFSIMKTSLRPTRSEIIEALTTTFFNTIKSGDKIVVYFSGHGIQVPDDGTDEIDHYDEALILYDTYQNDDEINPFGNIIRDDEFGTFVNSLRQKAGKHGHVFVITEACFSGTIGRNIANDIPGKSKIVEGKTILSDTGISGTDLARVVFLSSAMHDERSFSYRSNEQTICGALTLAITELLRSNTPYTYYELRERLELIIYNKFGLPQTPAIEGDVDDFVFGQKIVTKPAHYKVVDWLSKTELIINTGEIAGVFKHSKIELKSTDYKLVKGKVIFSGLTNSLVKLEKEIEFEQAINSRVWIMRKNLGECKVSLKIDIKSQEVKRKLVDSLLFNNNLVSCDKNYTIIIRDSVINFRHCLILKNRNNRLLENGIFYIQKGTYNKIMQRLVLYSRSDFLLRLASKSNSDKINFTHVPVLLKENVNGNKYIDKFLDPSKKMSKQMVSRYSSGETLVFEVFNKTNRKLYFNIIGISSDNSYSVLLPNTKPWMDSNEYQVLPNDSMIFKDTRIITHPPLGKTTFIIIASHLEKPDLRKAICSDSEIKQRDITTMDNLSKYIYSNFNTMRGDHEFPENEYFFNSQTIEIIE